MRFCRIFAFLSVTLAALSVAAAPPEGEPPQRDAPARAARLSFMEGAVSLRAAGSDTWGEGTLNRPVTVNDRIWADADSRAELHLGSSAVRLTSRTQVTITNLDAHTLQVGLSEGAIGVHVRDLPQGSLVEVDTPTAAITLRQVGAYRITVTPQDNTVAVVVRRGQAEVLAGGDAFEVPDGALATVTGEAGKATHALAREPAADGFDAWCDARDKREDNPPALHYVSRDTVGYEDLDAYGRWQDTSEYGPVWTPQDVDPTWAPYQDGQWSWIDPWGWTWIDAAAWGYAPSHYGRWVNYAGGWGWAPGPVVAYPVYAPALVGFIGGGYGSFGYGYRDPLVGWFPLGWNECYVPGYYASYHYVQQVNTSLNIPRIDLARIRHTQIYTNRGIPGAVTTVPQGFMQRGQPISGHRVQVPSSTLNQAEVTGFTAPVAPRMSSVIAANTAKAQPPAAGGRPLMMRHTPAPAAVPFALREAALQKSAGRPMVNAFNGAPAARMSGPARPTTPGPYSHPAAPVGHGATPPVIGPHPAPPHFNAPSVYHVQQPERGREPTVYRVPQPPRYEGPVYSSAPRYRGPTPHYSAPQGGGYAGAPQQHVEAPRFAVPAPHFAPAPHIAPVAPAPHFAPAPHMHR